MLVLMYGGRKKDLGLGLLEIKNLKCIDIIIIIWGVSRSRQHSRQYITVEDKAVIKFRRKT